MRLFIAIPIPQDIKNIIRETLANFKLKKIGNVKSVEFENLHLTLKFIGEFDNKHLICDVLNDELHSVNAFEMKFDKCGFFPTRFKPRVLWAGFGIGKENFTGLSKKINKSLKRIAIESETRKSVPHLTIMRVKQLCNEKFLEELKDELEAKLNGITISVKEIILFKSILSSRFPEYFELFTWTLNK